MPATLTTAAITVLKRVTELSEGTGSPSIPCVVWCSNRSRFDVERDTSISLGPGFVLGAFDGIEQARGYQLVEQDGCKFLLALPPDVEDWQSVLIDYRRGEFLLG